MAIALRPKNTSSGNSQMGCGMSCALMALFPDHKGKKSKCCKSFKHGKRCKKCPGKKKG